MNKPTNKNQGFTLIELLTVITIIGILFGIAFKGADVALTAGAKAKQSSNMRNILQAYKSYHDENGPIVEDIQEQEMVNTDDDEISYSNGTNHDWAAVLADVNKEMNDATVWLSKRDKGAKKENRKHKAKYVLDPAADEDNPEIDEDFQNSILCFNMFAGLEESEQDGASGTPVMYTAGLDEQGNWSKKAPNGKSGGHIGFMDAHVEAFKKITEDDFVKWEDPDQETELLQEAVNGAPLGHQGEDNFDGERK
tara:strand:+ start:469 stop:1224 length:756 start_codon:yes stop_codon:yes gene_type:complete